MAKRTQKPAQKPAQPDTAAFATKPIQMSEVERLSVQLANERAEHALVLARQRSAERGAMFQAIETKYCENGKYVVLEIDIAGTVTRVTAAEAAKMGKGKPKAADKDVAAEPVS